MERLYRWCLRLYPSSYKQVFFDEMVEVFVEARSAAVARGHWRYIRFLVRECCGALGGACFERGRELFGPEFSAMFPVGRLFMRSATKFPLSALVFMVLSFVTVVYAIAQAEALSVALPHDNPAVALHAVKLTMPGGILVMFVIAYLLGIAGWLAVHILRRSGAERLSRTETWSPAK
ncbi:hypothetical protein Acid345_2955 [Candidatus Koribacter versatilis Ellin345]|uniref:Uncharacterized protein n=1 Tax=Koribacter versatilis (strain Ellin345) TaxID=204669 RepID=Q1IME4_KORVE|nr:hypothetical protein [Candidatus Koribacter versatilis]ABF41956.1 hypothetical protein Acid345_2955 [Candidatus Koribacter versatilis Ellin345]